MDSGFITEKLLGRLSKGIVVPGAVVGWHGKTGKGRKPAQSR